MGCELAVYRARIGTWAARAVKWIPAASGQGSAEPTLCSFVILILAVLLVIGGVELNPGPVESVKCGVCKNNLRTGLLCITCSTWFHFSCQKLKRDQHIEENWRCRECMRDIAVETTDTEIESLKKEVAELKGKLLQAEERLREMEAENRRLREERHGEASEEKQILVVGDSMVRHVGQGNRDLEVLCYPGIRVEEVKLKLEQQERRDKKTVILHVGTNDLRGRYEYVMGDMYDLVVRTKELYPQAKIIISGIVRRRDFHWTRIGRLNKAFDWVADRTGATFVDPNSWIGDGDLGRDGVHLNRRGATGLGALFSRAAATERSNDQD